MNDPHRQIAHQFEKAELCLFHDEPTIDDISKARFNILDALDLMADVFKTIEPQLIHKQTK